MSLTTTALNQAVDALSFTQISLHSGAPGAAGANNEITGGGYSRQACTFGAAVNGVRTLSNQPTFSVGAGTTVSHYVVWDGVTAKDIGAFSTPETFSNAGTYKVSGSTITITSP